MGVVAIARPASRQGFSVASSARIYSDVGVERTTVMAASIFDRKRQEKCDVCLIRCGAEVPHGAGVQEPRLRQGVYTLLGLLANIKCSICSYQFNICYGDHQSP